MALFPYGLARPFLFGLDPEAAHELTLAMLSRTQGTPLQWAWCATPVHDPVEVAGVPFPNRFGLAAGLDKNAHCIDGLAAMGFGFIEVGTVTPKAQPGNPKPRIFRLPKAQALINRLGFNNDGLDAFVANVQLSKERRSGSPLRLGLNIGKNGATPNERATDDYLRCLDGVYPHADYVAVNVSSPNTKNLRALQNDEALDALIGAVMERRDELAAAETRARGQARHVPIFVKIAPDLDEEQIALIAATLKRHGSDARGRTKHSLGVIATNTTLARDAVRGMPHGDETGGLSGKPVFEASNRVIRALRAALPKRFPIIGVGGVMSGADARAKREAGADLVQVYTGLIYRGPGLVTEAARALAATPAT